MLTVVHPLVKAAPAIAAIAAIGGVTATRDSAPPTATRTQSAPTASVSPHGGDLERCPTGSLALASALPCTRLPEDGTTIRSAREAILGREPTASRRRVDDSDERVARLPERPSDWFAYQLPVVLRELPTVGAFKSAGGESTARLFPTTPGSAVQLTELENQVGDADVVAVGQLHGITVVTHHRVSREGGDTEYLVFHGQLDRPGPNVRVGAKLSALSVVGFIGDGTGVLDFEVRELRAPLATPTHHLSDLEKTSLAFAIDPRNALPLRH